MAVEYIIIKENNEVGESNLLPIHSPLIYEISTRFLGSEKPIYCDVKDDDLVDSVLGTFRLIFNESFDSGIYRFLFNASEIMRGILMYNVGNAGFEKIDFEDFYHAMNVAIEVPNITKSLTLKFYGEGELVEESESITQVFAHAAKQFGEQPNLSEIYNNENDFYYCPDVNGWAYIYFYNNDETNTIFIEEVPEVDAFAVDYDDVIFKASVDDASYTIDAV